MALSLCRFLYINVNKHEVCSYLRCLGALFRIKILFEIQEFTFFKFPSESVSTFYISNTFYPTVSLNINEFSGRNHVRTVMISVI